MTNLLDTFQADREDTMSLGPEATVPRQDVAVGERRFIIPSGSPQEHEPFVADQRNGATTGNLSSFGPSRVVRIPRAREARQRFILLQQWEGTVTTVNAEEFAAVLHDLTQLTRPEEEASFPIEEVPDPDRSLLVPGGVFYWTIGYEVTPTGTRKTVSMLRFRRLPAWGESELHRVRADAERLQKLLAPSS